VFPVFPVFPVAFFTLCRALRELGPDDSSRVRSVVLGTLGTCCKIKQLDWEHLWKLEWEHFGTTRMLSSDTANRGRASDSVPT
jgi:hypothetical protein